jgi:hypothetical protein
MKRVMKRVVLGPALLLISVSYFNNRFDLMWAAAFLLSLVAIGFLLKRYGKGMD